MAEATHDVITISSSDDDSDCQIVKVISSFDGRSKSKMRRQYQGCKLARPRRRKRMTRQLNEDVYDDDQDKEPTLLGYKQHSEMDLTAVSGDAARNGCSQSMDQSIEPLRFGSMADHSSSNGTNDAKTERSVMTRVDPTDPLAIRHYTADLGQASMLPPPFLLQSLDPSKQILDDKDKQRKIHSRSCSPTTLDLFHERAAAQQGNTQGAERDVQGTNTDTLDEQPELLLGGTTNSVDCGNHTQPYADSAIPPYGDDSTPPLESLPEGSNQDTIKIEESRDVEMGLLQPYGRAPAAYRRRLPRVGKRRAWSSVINFAAYEAMPKPLFAQQKKMIRSVTYADMIKERAKRKMNKSKGSNGEMEFC
ncbi:hypothetical protein GGI43DRAFT_307003 [Trichoderma evansii]